MKVVSRLVEVGKVRFTVESEVLGPGGEVYCRTKQELASVVLTTGKPRPLRDDWQKLQS